MIRRLLREVYMLSRGEQRALVFFSFLLILSVGIRIMVQLLPEKEPAGMEDFMKESQAFFASIALADSLQKLRNDSIRQVRQDFVTPNAYSCSKWTKRPVKKISINLADSVHLLPLPGIGPVFAGRIVKYRELLGGFVSPDQLCEVYGFPGETLDLIRDLIAIDSSAIRKICMDRASFKDFLRHPYLELEDVKALMDYRDFKHHISTLNELGVNQVLPESTLNRIGPYLDMKCEENHK